jgi:hypothetical protein
MELTEASLGRAKIIAVQALRGEIHMFWACIKISNELINLQNFPREITVIFAGIASEIDGLPIGDERQYWDPAALLEQDNETERYLAEVGPTLRKAMEKLIALA